MPENKNRFIVACQQLLVIGSVLAVAAPAATVVTLDIVAPAPGVPGQEGTAHAAGALVASEPVEPAIREIPLVAAEPARSQAPTRGRVAKQNGDSDVAVVSDPEKVSGYTTVGVTWAHDEAVAEDAITVSVRSLDEGAWSGWEQLEYHSDHGPDPDSAEGRKARPGTDPILVGDVDEVQVKVETPDGSLPTGTELAVIDPGTSDHPTVEQPAIDTAELPDAGAVSLAAATTAPTTTTGDPVPTDPEAPTGPDTEAPVDDGGVLVGDPAWVTPKPKIFSRAQWGADERMRDASSLSYFEVHAGFVHHTVNANGYTRAQVPSLMRGIYAYHTQSRGWSDVGYNFIVDRFGRIWEGRYGGVDRPVVGAHTLGYNEYSFAMSALGNFDVAKPPAAMIDAYGRMFAWKLSLHGVSASSTSQQVGSRAFPAINGHRDAGQTACPGKFLYAQLPAIRTLAAKYQKPFETRTRSTNVAGSPWPDLVVRDKATRKAFVVRTGGQLGFQRGQLARRGWKSMDLVAAVRDVTGDGIADMVGRNGATGTAGVYPGTAQGKFSDPVMTTGRFAGLDQLTGSLDLTGDGENDVVGREAGTKKLYVYPGNGGGGFSTRQLLSGSWGGYNLTTGVGDLTGDGNPDLVARNLGRLVVVPGTGRGIGTPLALPGKWGSYDLVSGLGDLTGDGLVDLVARTRRTKMTFVFPGNGAGGLGHRFGPFSQFKTMTFLSANGHLAGQPGIDLVGRNARGRLQVFPNTGGKGVEAVAYSGQKLGGVNLVLNVGDWNKDGYGDVMTRRAKTGVLELRPGTGKGTFAAPVKAATGWGRVRLAAAVGDLTGDGNPDLVGQPKGAGMRVYPGNGASGFKSSFAAYGAVTSNGQTGLGLWDGDGSPDSLMRRADGSLMLYPGNGPGGLMSPRKIGSGASRWDWLSAVGDGDGDGRPDLLGRQKSDGTLWLVPGTKAGFGAPRFVAAGFGRYDLTS